MPVRRAVQAASFFFFMILVFSTVFPLRSPLPVDLFVRMDPLVAMATVISKRGFVGTLLPGFVLMALTAIFGRFFCSMVCPLGTSVDMADTVTRGGAAMKFEKKDFKLVKYLVLIFILTGALLEVSWTALAAPIPIITRFFALLIYPVLTLAADAGITVLRPAAERAGISWLAYADLVNPVFGLGWLVLALPAGIFALASCSRRFWCRYLCPAGAALALFSWRPLLLRRTVSAECTSCGLCRKACPMDAIAADPRVTDHAECILCRGCKDICPEGAVGFLGAQGGLSGHAATFSSRRRALVLAALAGFASALLVRSGLSGSSCVGGPGRVADPKLLRPPGAVPECSFLNRCVGCGECMKVCPTNTLQPAGLSAGITGLFSPLLMARRGPCDPACNACGQVCPTGAIRALSLEEKRYAKIGTATIMRQRCIAWEQGKACLICDEVCPYGAVSLQHTEGVEVAVPYVEERKCNGCGFCEFYCPVQAQAAIVVEPMEAIRIEGGSYRETSGQLGLSIEPKDHGSGANEEVPEAPGQALPPGFTE